MNLIKQFVTIMTLCISVCLTAQPQERTIYYEEKGEELIDKASQKIQSYESLVIHFSYITENTSHDQQDAASGVIYLKGDKYNIAIDDHEYISDGNTVWVYMKDVREIHINDAENIEQSMNPVHMLNDFREHYRAKLIRQETVLGKIVNLVDVIPTKPHAFFKYRVAILDSDHMLSYIKAYDRHSGTYKIQLDKIEKNADFPDEKFQFDESQYTDMDIIDLR